MLGTQQKKSLGSNMKTDGDRPSSPRAAILDALKAHVSPDAEARADFRADVQTIFEKWDGRNPLLFFTWEEGTHVMLLGPASAPSPKVWNDRRILQAAIDMARGGKCFMVDDERATPMQVAFGDLPETLYNYYDKKEPLA